MELEKLLDPILDAPTCYPEKERVESNAKKICCIGTKSTMI